MGKIYLSILQTRYYYFFSPFLRLLPFVLFICLFTETRANETIGADISWTSVKEGEYKISYRTFRLCDNKTPDIYMKLYVRCLETNAVKEINYDTSSYKVTKGLPECFDTVPCNPQHDIHSFESLLDFNTDTFLLSQMANGGCRFELELTTYWSFASSHYPDRTIFYVSAMLNICNLENAWTKTDNSPQFTFNPNSFVICNQPVNMTSGVYDKDKDSLVFSLIAPRSALKTDEKLDPNPYELTPQWPFYSYCRRYDSDNKCVPRPERNPPEGFHLDYQSGNMIFQPTICNAINQLVLKIDQYRLDSTGKNMLHLGYTTQEFSVEVNNDINRPPLIQNVEVKPVCEGEKICLDIEAFDLEYAGSSGQQPWRDSIDLIYNNAIPDATWDLDSPAFINNQGVISAYRKGTWCWETKIGDANLNPYLISFNAIDKACRIPAMSQKTFQIKVFPYMEAKSQRIFSIDSFGNLFVEHLATGKDTIFNRHNKYDFKWQFIDLNDGNLVATSNKQKDIIGFSKPGTYQVVSSVSYTTANCPEYFYDTVTIICDLTKLPEFKTQVIPKICEGEQLCFDLEATVDLNHATNPVPETHAINLTWDKSIPDANWLLYNSQVITDSSGTYAYRKARFCLQTKENMVINPFTVIAKNKNCSFEDSVILTISLPVNNLTSATRIFSHDSLGVLFFESIPDEAGVFNHHWEIRDSTNTGAPYFTSQLEKDNFALPYSGTFIITYQITNQKNCIKTYLDTLIVCVDNHAPEFKEVNVRPVCAGDSFCFDIEVYDEQSNRQSWEDIIELNWDSAITNATWEVSLPSFVLLNNINYAYRKAKFCWNTKTDDGKTTPYMLNVTASDLGCPSKTVTAKSIEIYVYPNPSAQRMYSQDSLGKLTFESVPDNAANMTHEWIIRNSSNTGNPIYTSNKIKDSYEFQDTGTFVITYIITDTMSNCTETYVDRLKVIKNNVSVQFHQFGQLKVFPNPADNVVFIEVQSSTIENLKVYDVSGKVIFEKAIHDKTFKVETKNWAPGTYIFEIKSNEQTVRVKQLIVK